MTSIQLAYGDGSWTLDVRGYEREVFDNESDANWLCANCSVRLGEFIAASNVAITTNDMRYLCTQLDAVTHGTASSLDFANDDDTCRLRVRMNNRGNGTLSGRMVSAMHVRTYMEFEFEIDRTVCAHAAASLREVVAAYPIRSIAR